MLQACLNFSSGRFDCLEWNERPRITVASLCPIAILGNRPEAQAEHKINPTDFGGGTVQVDSRAGVPPGGQRVLLTQRIASHANTGQGMPQTQAVLAIQVAPPGQIYSESYDIRRGSTRTSGVSMNISSALLLEIYRQSLVVHYPVFSLVSLLVRSWPF